MDINKEGTTPVIDETGNEVETLKSALAAASAERDDVKSRLRALGKDSETLKTLRSELETLMTDKSKIHAEFDSFKEQVRTREIDTHVATALAAAGAHNPTTVKKLLDLKTVKFGEDGLIVQESIAEMVNAVKTSDSYLFKSESSEKKTEETSTPTIPGNLPKVERAVQGQATDAFRLDLEAAKKAKDPFAAIEAVMKKHGKS